MRASLRLGLAALTLMGTISCVAEPERSDASFTRLHYRRVSSAPGLVSLRDNAITLERGLAVRARVSAIGDDGKPLDLLRLTSNDEAVFRIEKGPRLGEYVFYGPQAGTTEVEVYSDDRFKGSVPVEILEQDF